MREAAREALPRHYAVTCWKHAAASEVEQDGVRPAPKDRGAEQGDVDGSLECSLTLGRVAAASRHRVHVAQRAGLLPWATANEESQRHAAGEFDERAARTSAWEATPPAGRRQESGAGPVVPDPRHEVQADGGLADFWYLDDGDVLCDPCLVQPFFASFDSVNPSVGAERNLLKTEVIYFASQEELGAHAEEWQLAAVRALATVSTADDAGLDHPWSRDWRKFNG